jgi:hypothetical protein
MRGPASLPCGRARTAPVNHVCLLRMSSLPSYTSNFYYSASTATSIRVVRIKSLAKTADLVFFASNIALWSIIEEGIGILACSLATLKPLLSKYFKQDSTNGRDSNRSHSSIVDDSGQRRGGTPFRIRDIYSSRAEQDLMELQLVLGLGTVTAAV